MKTTVCAVCILFLLGASVTLLAQEPTTCPAFLPAGVTCHSGTGTYGRPYIIVMPGSWDGTLIRVNAPSGQATVVGRRYSHERS